MRIAKNGEACDRRQSQKAERRTQESRRRAKTDILICTAFLRRGMTAPSLVADRYEIKELLGEGGMGVVYRAIDVKTKSSVAFKTMRDVSDPLAVELFSKEW